ncbi:uncharacterized protein B0H18DRAFT_1115023 [Fomitopsis serialis]|uniref:uncharacterized protein n=1 Tax=Fomitopsis serialis TaxID=139415 RepID=UPI0020088767|nr:uncharacterized protein B0H18DRAFT_1115023 [Neoantrodia serialis]KAH9934301.1 hypothetical protein B0H18DRAFT_1115023 [Neoantrodia serialis]
MTDVTGNKRIFIFETGWFTIRSFATAASPNKYAMTVFVALTGVGAAANTPTGMYRHVKKRAISVALGAG